MCTSTENHIAYLLGVVRPNAVNGLLSVDVRAAGGGVAAGGRGVALLSRGPAPVIIPTIIVLSGTHPGGGGAGVNGNSVW
jgi:hypothetical protein